MVKRVCAIVTAVFFLFAALPLLAEAGQPSVRQQLIKKSIAGLKQTIEVADAGELSALNAVTAQFLDDILAAGLKKQQSRPAACRYALCLRCSADSGH